MFDRSHDATANGKAFEFATSYHDVCLALEADFLSPTGKVAVIVDVYVEEITAQSSASGKVVQAAYDVRQALREYQNARKATVFGLGVSDRTKGAREDLFKSLSRLHALTPLGTSHR